METVLVYSTVEDKEIKKNLENSPIWKNAIHSDDLEAEQKPGVPMFEYKIKFEGLKPVQVSSVKKLVK